MDIYVGKNDNGIRTVLRNKKVFNPTKDGLVGYSDSFCWGDESLESTQLALMIASKEFPEMNPYEQVKKLLKLVSRLHDDGWKLTSEEIKGYVLGTKKLTQIG